MRFHLLKFIFFSFVTFFNYNSLQAQDFNMQNGTVNICSGTFYDSGGPDGDYNSDENFVYTICPEDPNLISVIEFIDFVTPEGTDILNIYDGYDTSAPQIVQLTGNEVDLTNGDSPIEFTGSEPDENPSGCLTFEFISDSFLESDGWEANILCREQCPILNAAIDDISPSIENSNPNIISVGKNMPIDFTASVDPESNDVSNLTFTWSFDDLSENGQSITQTFSELGTISASLKVTNNDIQDQECSEIIDFTLDVVQSNVIIDDSFTANDLIEDVMIGGVCAVSGNVQSPNNSQINGQGYSSFGYFDGRSSPFTFDEGIVMMTYDVSSIPNGSTNGGGGWPGDADLEALIQEPGGTNDATSITFEFTPYVDHIDFNYIFASYEYPNFVCNFADTFAFILSGPGISDVNAYDHDGNPATPQVNLDLGGLNIATVPGTQNVPVSPVNVHDENCSSGLGEYAFPAFYDNANSESNNPDDIDLTGRTIPMTASADVIPGQTYTIKLVIADRADTLLDSAVFLEKASFDLGAFLGSDININDAEALCEGESVTLDIFDGVLPPGFNVQWEQNGQVIAGETGASLTIDESGVYTINIQTANNCIESESVEINFVPSPEIQDQLDFGITKCVDTFSSTTSFDLTQNNAQSLVGQNAFNFEVTYYETQNDADNKTNQITNPSNYTTATVPKTLFLRVENVAGSQTCYATTSFDINTSLSTIIQQTPALEFCHDDVTSFPSIDLTQNDKTALNVTNPNEAELVYFLTQADADANTNAIADPVNFIPTAEQQDIFVRAQNTSNNSCYSVDDFTINVYRTEANPPAESLMACPDNDNNPDLASFNLTEKELEILGSDQSPSDVNIAYYSSQNDADNDMNPIANLTDYQNTTDPQTIYVRVENLNAPDDLNNCAAFTDFTLEVLDADSDDCTLDINELNKLAFKIYPNPFQESINLSWDNKDLSNQLNVSVHSIDGKKVFDNTFKQKPETLNLAKLSTGIYFIKIRSANQTFVKRIIKK